MSCNLPVHNFCFRSGSKVSRQVTWKPGGVAFDFTGVDVNLLISKKKGQDTPDLTLTVGSGITLVDAVNGIIRIDITKAQALNLEGLYQYDLKLDTDGDLILTGTIHFEKDV